MLELVLLKRHRRGNYEDGKTNAGGPQGACARMHVAGSSCRTLWSQIYACCDKL